MSIIKITLFIHLLKMHTHMNECVNGCTDLDELVKCELILHFLFLRHEGRTWYTPHRGKLWIAATVKQPDQSEISSVENFYRKRSGKLHVYHMTSTHISIMLTCIDRSIVANVQNYLAFGIGGDDIQFPSEYPTKCLLGCVHVADCLAQDTYREKVTFLPFSALFHHYHPHTCTHTHSIVMVSQSHLMCSSVSILNNCLLNFQCQANIKYVSEHVNKYSVNE